MGGEQATSGSMVGLGIEYIQTIPNVKWGLGAFETIVNVVVTPVSLGSEEELNKFSIYIILFCQDLFSDSIGFLFKFSI
jgi:hypothetical protein